VSEDLAETWFRMSESTPNKKLAEIYLKNAQRLAPVKVQNIQSDRVREKLPDQVRNRDYAGAVTSLCSLLEIHGWQSTFMLLQEMCGDSDNLRERGGDVLFHLLGLDFLMGLEIDPLVEFSGLKGNDLESLKREAQERAFQALKRQVALGNTYYLDAERLRDLPFLLVLPDILNIREQEILALSDTPSHSEVLSTYYGFMILTTAWNLEVGIRAFIEMCGSLGKRIEIRTKRLNMRASMWKHMSHRMQILLMQTARLCFSKSSFVQKSAIELLGETGDFRALQVLSEASSHVVDSEVSSVLKKMLERMGGVHLEKEHEPKRSVYSHSVRSTYVPMDVFDKYDYQYKEKDEYDECCDNNL
jgi:hypothetical protein